MIDEAIMAAAQALGFILLTAALCLLSGLPDGVEQWLAFCPALTLDTEAERMGACWWSTERPQGGPGAAQRGRAVDAAAALHHGQAGPSGHSSAPRWLPNMHVPLQPLCI